MNATTILGGLMALAIALALLAWRDRRALRAARTRVDLLTNAINSADAAFIIYDRNDRLVHASPVYRALYPGTEQGFNTGRSFRELIDEVAAAGLIPGDATEVEAWKAARMRLHEEGGTYVRVLRDGRWRRVTDQRLPDGSRLGFSIDVTDLVHRSHALEAARAEAQQARQRLQEAIDALPAGFELFDADDRLIMSNQGLRDLFPRVATMLERPGHTWEEIVRANVAAGGLPDIDADKVEEWLARRREQRGRTSSHTLVRVGSQWVRTIERRTQDGGIVGVRVDVTEAIEQREAAETARARLQDAIDNLPDGFALYDGEDKLIVCNANYRSHYRASAPAIIVGNSFEAILRYGLARGQYPQAEGREREWLRERLHRHRHPGEPLMQELPGNRWLRIDESPTQDGGVTGVSSDVTELVLREQALQRANAELDAARARLEQLSDTDSLTGIANRRQLDRRLRDEWGRARRLAQPFALLLIDVDHFKRFNDAHGHLEGDDCLRGVATTLQEAVGRASDLVARFGGEEFAILLPHTDRAGAEQVARDCLAAIDTAAIPHGNSPVAPHLTISIGIASAADASASGSAEQLLNAADGALFEAKQNGRHQACIAAPL